MSNTTIITDAAIIATLLLELQAHTGESYVDGLTRLFPTLEAARLEGVANDAQIEQERRDTEALTDNLQA